MGAYVVSTAPQMSPALAGNIWQQPEPQVPLAEAASVSGSEHSSHTAYAPSYRLLQHFTSAHCQYPAAQQPPNDASFALHPIVYDTSPDNSSQADSTDQQALAWQQYHQHHNNQPSMQYAMPEAFDQADRLRAELAKKKSRIAELQHEVDTTDSHRRQVQAHNHDLEEQLAQALHMLQGYSGGYQAADNTAQMHQLTIQNAGLKAQLEQLSQQLYQSSGSSIERKNAELQQKVHDLQETVSQLTAQHSAQPGAREAELEQASNEKLSALKSQESQQLLHLKAQHDVLTDQLTKRVQELEAGEEDSKHEHQNELSMLESGKEQLIAELNSKHTSLVDQLTQQAEKLEVDLREAHNVSKDAAGKHANELRALLEQKQQLEADVQEAQEGSKITEGKLYDAEVGLVEAEEKLSETEQKLKQFEQRASKTAKTIRAQEKQLSQLGDQTVTLKEELADLKSSVKALTDENSRLIRESKLAHERFANIQKEKRELQDRLVDYALQAMDASTDYAFSEAAGDANWGRSARSPAGCDKQLQKSQEAEAVIAELEDCQRTHDMAAGPVTLAAVARERMQQVSFRMRDASLGTSDSTGLGAANDVVVPKVDFPRPKSFKPRTHNRRRSSDLDNFAGPKISASPAVSLPMVEADLPSPATEP
ncbi:TPA: hypothetical protein ACH3X3_003731 [Trebouxia sp. C0006]